MKSFLGDDFLLSNETGKALYHNVAKRMPILDYHCHVNPREIAENRLFKNLTQLWLEEDHYKWRLMRANGVDERYITGNAGDFEKFQKWACTLEKAVGNPVYQWSHLELRRYFNFTGFLTGANAEEVWNFCNEVLGDGIGVQDILKKSEVTLLCTTDDPLDTLEWHGRMATETDLETKVLPAFRPDKVVNIEKPDFVDYIKRLSHVAGIEILDWETLTAALEKRMNFFDSYGGRVADHGLDNITYLPVDEKKVNALFKRRLSGESLSEKEQGEYKTKLLVFLGRNYARRKWVMQLHFSAQRDNNKLMFRKLGPDSGYDCIGPGVNISDLASFMSLLEEKGELPRTILYSLNPKDNEPLAVLAGCFQSSDVPGKIQHGSSWWFNDHKTGMTNQLVSLANVGLLGNFIGMLTDSRSFLSYVRHEYFRRILCDLIGRWAEAGEFPRDMIALERLVADISYRNSVRYFNVEHHHLRGAERT